MFVTILVDENLVMYIERIISLKLLEEHHIVVMIDAQMLIEIENLDKYSLSVPDECILSVEHITEPFNIIGFDLPVTDGLENIPEKSDAELLKSPIFRKRT